MIKCYLVTEDILYGNINPVKVFLDKAAAEKYVENYKPKAYLQCMDVFELELVEDEND